MTPHGSGRPILDGDPYGQPGPRGDPAADAPNVARMYDYMTGGCRNFGADRRAVELLVREAPQAIAAARANRAFVARAMRFLLDAGIRQFVDLGSGIPGPSGPHVVAQRSAPDARVLYVDIDPVAVAHGTRVLAGNADAQIIRADLRRPDHILAHPEFVARIDPTRPVAVLMNAVLHFCADHDDPAGLVASYRDAVPPGSYLVISHATPLRGPAGEVLARTYADTGMPLCPRSPDRVRRLFAGVDMVPPGLVRATDWRPGDDLPAGPDTGRAHGVDGDNGDDRDNGDDAPIVAGIASVPATALRGPRRDSWAARSRNGLPASRVDPAPPRDPAVPGNASRTAGRYGGRATPRSRWAAIGDGRPGIRVATT